MIVIKYHERLGDIIQCFPIAFHFFSKGEEVWFECKEMYHGIFDTVSYVRPVAPGMGEKMMVYCASNGLPVALHDLQVHPDKLEAYRASEKPWREFVYGLIPELNIENHVPRFELLPAREDILSRYELPNDYALVAPFGYSQHTKIEPEDILEWFDTKFDSKYYPHVLCDEDQITMAQELIMHDDHAIHAFHLRDLPALIKYAKEFLCINSAPSIIASAVRDSYYHIPEKLDQDDYKAANQIRIEL